MLRITFRVLVAAVSVALAAEQAQAGWGHHRGWGSSGGSWGSSGGSWGSSGSSGGWYSYGSSGSSGGRWGSSGGSWGSSGSSGGWYSYGSCGSSGGSHGSSGGSSGGYQAPSAPQQGAPPAATPPAATPPAPSEPAPSANYHPTYGPMRNSALLSVKVPADAKVFVNDHETTSTGSDREFISRDLQAGARYNYEVRAEFIRDGKTVTENKTIQLASGQTAALDFAGDVNVQTAAKADSRTTLVVHIPADAKLYLAGHETKATGEVREFSTTKLPSGSEWATYAIRAVVERDGQQQVREETISIKAGESRDVTISFDSLASEKVATGTAAR